MVISGFQFSCILSFKDLWVLVPPEGYWVLLPTSHYLRRKDLQLKIYHESFHFIPTINPEQMIKLFSLTLVNMEVHDVFRLPWF